MLDNCEHVIEAAARMAEALLRADPHAHVLATSREPLRATGEYVYRVLPLAVPAEGAEDHEDLLDAAAVKLFVARAQAMDLHFSLDARRAAITGAVCRRLDGIPLAIELAAARTATLGVEGLAAHLDDRFHLLTGGHRTALPRHQTLRATLDWSYELLPAIERTVLHRLAVFAGGFTLEAASAVAAGADLDAPDVLDSVANLAAKSLVVVEIAGAVTRYRLLETTRAYALEKLTDSGELDRVARRHAEYFRDLFERAETERETRPTVEWLAAYGRQIDNVRTALDWAFSPRGDASIGVALTAAAVPLWFQQSLLVECRGRAERALASLGAAPGPGRAARDAAPRRARGVAHAHEGGGARHHRGLDHRPRDRRAPRRHRVPAPGALGPVAFPRQPRRVSPGAGAGGTLPRPGRQHRRSARRRADGRRFAALPGRPDECAAAPRAHARSLSSIRFADRTPSAFNTTRRSRPT